MSTIAKKRQPVLALAHMEPADQVDQAQDLPPIINTIAAACLPLSPMQQMHVLATARALADVTPVELPPALSPAAALIMDEIVSLPPYRGVTIERMSDLLFHAGIKRAKADGSPRPWSDREIRKEIIPKLEKWGVVSTARIGYRLPASARNLHLMGRISGRMATTSNS